MYFFVVIFALVSLLQDEKIKSILSKHYNKTWKKFTKRVEEELTLPDKVDDSEYEQKFFGKD
jgi:hypothetical protein